MYTRETLVKSSQYRCSEIKLTCTKSHVDCPDIWMIINSKPLTNRSKLVSWRSSSSGPNLVMTSLNSVCSNLSKKNLIIFLRIYFFSYELMFAIYSSLSIYFYFVLTNQSNTQRNTMLDEALIDSTDQLRDDKESSARPDVPGWSKMAFTCTRMEPMMNASLALVPQWLLKGSERMSLWSGEANIGSIDRQNYSCWIYTLHVDTAGETHIKSETLVP